MQAFCELFFIFFKIFYFYNFCYLSFYMGSPPTSYTPANFGRSGTRTDAANSSFNYGNKQVCNEKV